MRPAVLLVLFVALLPAVIALVVLSGEPWDTPHSVLRNLGRFTGIAGLGLMLVPAILSVRIPGFDKRFGGLTKLWRIHHLMAAHAFLLLLAHPLLLALGEPGGIARVASVLWPEHGRMAAGTGWAALIVMMIFLAPSFHFFGRPDYQWWKTLHRLAGVAIAFALVHAFMLERTIPSPLDYLLWGTLVLLAFAALSWRWFFSRLGPRGRAGRLPYEVTRVDPVSAGAVELSLRPVSRPLEYESGQFIYLSPYDASLEAGYSQEHPYTPSSAPAEEALRVLIKDLGDASHAIQRIRIGSEVSVEGPYGALFESADPERAQLWIAGGIGITPFLSRARDLHSRGLPANVCLIFCVQDEARTMCADEFARISSAVEGFEFYLHYFYREGPLSLEFVNSRCPEVAEREVYACGPPPLLALTRNLATSAGVPRTRFHSEDFDLL